MRKIALRLIAIGFLAGLSVMSVHPQTRVNFGLNLGIQTNLSSSKSFDEARFTMDARLGIPLDQHFEISPEVMAAVDYRLHFDLIWLYPGAMLNLKLGNFFVGFGAVLPIRFFDGESDTSKIEPKVNFGFRTKNLVLTAYIFSWTGSGSDFFGYNYIGTTIGFTF